MADKTFVDVIALDKLRDGFVTRFDVAGRAIIITRSGDSIHAFDGTCTHANFQFATSRLVNGCEVECPMHGAFFDAASGEPTDGPAETPLERLTVSYEDGMVRIAVDWTATVRP